MTSSRFSSSQVRRRADARANRDARACRGADPARGLLPWCLCTNMWMTCAQRRRACVYTVEMLGIPLPDRNQNRAFTWESANHTLCIQKKLELSTSRTAIPDELAERLSQIYTFVI